MSKVRWKDTLSEVDNPSLGWAAMWLTDALLAHSGGNAKGARVNAGRAAANIRGVRKSLGVDSERVDLVDDLNGANLLWAATCGIAEAALWLPDAPRIAARNLRYVEAAIRTYMTEATS